MKYMQCPICKKTVEQNATGICLSCQKGFSQKKQKDVWQKKEISLSDILTAKAKGLPHDREL